MTIGFLFLAPSVLGGRPGYRTPDEIHAIVRGTRAAGELTEAGRVSARRARDRIAELPGVTAGHDIEGVACGVEIPDALVDGYLDDIVDAAVDTGCTLVKISREEAGTAHVLVNTSGGTTDCRMRNSRDDLVLHVDRESLRDTLDRDVARQSTQDGRPFIVVEPVETDLSPVPGVVFVQAARLPDGRWTVEHGAGGQVLELAVPVASVAEVVQITGRFLDGDGEAFLDLDWRDAGVGAAEAPRPVTFRFFRAADFDDTPGEFRTHRDFGDAAAAFAAYADSPEADADPVPEVLETFAAWMNRRAVRAAEDPANPPADLYMDLDPYPVRPRGRMLTVTIPLAAHIHDDTFADLLLRAAALDLCMLEDSGRVWVNASGSGATHCRLSVRGGGLVTTASPEALRAVLESAVIAGTEGFVVSVEPSGVDVPQPVEGVREVQVGIGDRRWIVHRLADGSRFSLVDPGTTVEDVVTLLTAYVKGDAAALLDREWEDISEGTVPDETSRWQLSDSAGNVFNVGEEEVHVAVPMNYAPDLDWFQVADQVVVGDYITADRHLGTRWSVMWGHGFGEEQYYRRIVDTREDAESLIHAYIDEPEQVFLARGWDLVDND